MIGVGILGLARSAPRAQDGGLERSKSFLDGKLEEGRQLGKPSNSLGISLMQPTRFITLGSEMTTLVVSPLVLGQESIGTVLGTTTCRSSEGPSLAHFAYIYQFTR